MMWRSRSWALCSEKLPLRKSSQRTSKNIGKKIRRRKIKRSNTKEEAGKISFQQTNRESFFLRREKLTGAAVNQEDELEGTEKIN